MKIREIGELIWAALDRLFLVDSALLECEHNRDGRDPKGVTPIQEVDATDLRAITVLPDIIAHCRAVPNNLLVILKQRRLKTRKSRVT